MKLIAPDYYENFTCIAGKCKHSCCIGWEIDIDEDTLARYGAVEGAFGERLRAGIEMTEGGACFRLGEDERCPFLNENGLCDIILNLGEDCLSQICTDHPRFCSFFSDRTEIGLGLCCEEAGRLILSRKEKMALSILQDDGEKEPLTWEEKEFFRVREYIFELAQNREKSISERIDGVLLAFGIVTRRSFAEWIDIFLGLEIMDGAWENLLREVRGFEGGDGAEAWDIAWEQLLCYFLYRHVSDAQANIAQRVFFAVLSVLMIRRIFAYICERDGKEDFAALVELCRLYSSEIEYSEENTDFLYNC
jgi:lysine-N-methylase